MTEQRLYGPDGGPRKPTRFSQCEKILRVLQDGHWHTTSEVLRQVPSTVHSRISELRKRGYIIEHETTGVGASGSRYRLIESAGSDLDTSGGAGAPSPQSDAPSDSAEQLTLVDVWREGLAPNVVYLRDPDQDNYSRKVGAA